MGVNSWALMDDSFSMDGIMPSIWGYQDTIEELQQKLHYATEELKSFQMSANENSKKQAEYIDRLLQFLKITCQERDEARNQLHFLMKKLTPEPETPLVVPANKNNSGTIESDSVSDTRNNQHSYVSSPVDPFFDTVTSPELSNVNVADSCPTFAGYNPKYAKIEQLVTKKPLPEKGKLVAAVMDAGPLLQTLMIAGPLPRWRNPPTLQPLVVPPVSINCAVSKSTPVVGPSILIQNSYNASQRNDDISRGVHQTNAGISGLCAVKRSVVSPCVGGYQCLSTKRQKINQS